MGPAASLSPDPSTVTFAADGAWHRFTIQAGEPVSVVVNPEGTAPRLEITTRSGRSNFCPAEADDYLSRRDGQVVYVAGCATGTATVELRRRSDGTVLNTYTFEVTGSPVDLVVEAVSVSDSTLTPGQSFTLRATVRNQGTGLSSATTLRYYHSSSRTKTTRETQVGTDAVGALGASRTSAESIRLTAPSSEGTHYYSACVGSVSGESDTRNNCSRALRVTVASAPASHVWKLYWTNWDGKKVQRFSPRRQRRRRSRQIGEIVKAVRPNWYHGWSRARRGRSGPGGQGIGRRQHADDRAVDYAARHGPQSGHRIVSCHDLAVLPLVQRHHLDE